MSIARRRKEYHRLCWKFTIEKCLFFEQFTIIIQINNTKSCFTLLLIWNTYNFYAKIANIIINSSFKCSLWLRQIHLWYLSLIRIGLSHILIMLLFECAYFMILHCFLCDVFLLKLLRQFIICLLLFIVEFIELYLS